VTILGYQLVHWEDSDSLAASSVNIVNGCKEGPLLYKVYNYTYMFGAGPTWTPAYFVLKYVYIDYFPSAVTWGRLHKRSGHQIPSPGNL